MFNDKSNPFYNIIILNRRDNILTKSHRLLTILIKKSICEIVIRKLVTGYIKHKDINMAIRTNIIQQKVIK